MAGSVHFPEIYYDSSYAQKEDSKKNKSSIERRDCAGTLYGRLFEGTLIQEPGVQSVFEPGSRVNRNIILCLTNARLLRDIYLNGIIFSNKYQLLCGIPLNLSNDTFFMIIRTDGRIITLSDEAVHHFGKSMRLLYTQFINVYECLNESDGSKLKSILNSSNNITEEEHSLVCEFRLPKGKRSSRTNEDVKTIYMAGHFYTCENSSRQPERLFIARCEALITSTTKRASNIQSTTTYIDENSKSIMTITLQQDLSISTISSNVKNMLGYTSGEMIGRSFESFLATDDIEKFQKIQQKFFQHEQQQQQKQQQQQNQKLSPLNLCDVFDMYGNNGDERLTFLFQIRIKRQRRSRPIEFVIVAQLIDPRLRSQYIEYVDVKSTEIQQVNLEFSSQLQTSPDSSISPSPSLDMGLLRFDCISSDDLPNVSQQSPFNRQLSNVVAPINLDDEFWEQFCNNDYSQYPTTADSQYWPTDCSYDAIPTCQSELDLTSAVDDFVELYGINDFDLYKMT